MHSNVSIERKNIQIDTTAYIDAFTVKQMLITDEDGQISFWSVIVMFDVANDIFLYPSFPIPLLKGWKFDTGWQTALEPISLISASI